MRYFLLLLIYICLNANTNAATEINHKKVGDFDFREILNYKKDLELDHEFFEVFDINNDGYDDLIFGIYVRDIKTGLHKENEFVKPVIFFWNQITKEYKISEAVQDQLPEIYYPRRVTSYYDKTKEITSIFIADHGLDGIHKPNCGAKNPILNFKINSNEVSHFYPNPVNDYSHGLISLDLNKDGLLDHLVLNSPYINSQKCKFSKFTNNSYFLLTNKDGSYKRKEAKFNVKLFEKIPHYDAGHAIIINDEVFFILGRGYKDNIESGIDIYSLNKNLELVKTQSIPSPSELKSVSYSEITSLENLVFANAVDTTKGWFGRFIQVLEFRENKFELANEKFTQVNPKVQENEKVDWCFEINILEHAKETLFICATRRSFDESRPKIYKLEKNIFKPIEISSNETQIGGKHRGLRPINHNGKTKLISWDYTGDREMPSGMVYEKIQLNLINLIGILEDCDNECDKKRRSLIRKKVSSNTQFKQCLINENIPTKDLNAVIFTPFANRVENILTSIIQTDCYIKYLEN